MQVVPSRAIVPTLSFAFHPRIKPLLLAEDDFAYATPSLRP